MAKKELEKTEKKPAAPAKKAAVKAISASKKKVEEAAIREDPVSKPKKAAPSAGKPALQSAKTDTMTLATPRTLAPSKSASAAAGKAAMAPPVKPTAENIFKPVAALKPAPVAAANAAPVATAKPAPVVLAKPAPVATVKLAPVVAAKSAPVAAVKSAPVAAVKPAPAAVAKPEPVAVAKPAPMPEVKAVVAPKSVAQPKPAETIEVAAPVIPKTARKTPAKKAAAVTSVEPKSRGRKRKTVEGDGATPTAPETLSTMAGMVYEPSSTSAGASDNLVMQARAHQFELEQRGAKQPYVEPIPAAARDLPERYNETKLILLPRDPEWAYAYWEVAYHDAQSFKVSEGNMRLRLYDVTDVDFNGGNAHSFVDFAVGASSNWYLRLPATDRHWVADLGVVMPDGKFRTIIRSNTIMPPRNSVSPFVAEEEEWMTIQSDFERIFELSGGRVARGGGVGGSQEARNLQRAQFEIPRISMGSEALASGALVRKGEFAVPTEGRGFRLVVNTELIVYGATEPDASVSIQGHPVRLNPDGTFRLRIALNDGMLEIPVKATRADGEETREITPVVTRETK